jgi:hypothetical protein
MQHEDCHWLDWVIVLIVAQVEFNHLVGLLSGGHLGNTKVHYRNAAECKIKTDNLKPSRTLAQFFLTYSIICWTG